MIRHRETLPVPLSPRIRMVNRCPFGPPSQYFFLLVTAVTQSWQVWFAKIHNGTTPPFAGRRGEGPGRELRGGRDLAAGECLAVDHRPKQRFDA